MSGIYYKNTFVDGALSVVVVVLGNGIGNPSSNPGQGFLHFTLL